MRHLQDGVKVILIKYKSKKHAILNEIGTLAYNATAIS